MRKILGSTFLLVSLSFVVACGGGGGGDDDDGDDDGQAPVPANLPLIRPPIEASVPAGLLGATARAHLAPPSSLNATDVATRFFGPGPTYIFSILDDVDGRIGFFNTGSENAYHPCVEAEPVEYSITPVGQTVTMYAQISVTA